MYLNQVESRNPKNTGENNQCQAVSARMNCGTDKLCSVRHWLSNKHGCHWTAGLNGSEKNILQSFSSTVTWCFVIKHQEPITQWCGIISWKNGNLSHTTTIPKILHNIPQVYVGWQPFLDAEGSWMLTVQAVLVLSAHTNHEAAL